VIQGGGEKETIIVNCHSKLAHLGLVVLIVRVLLLFLHMMMLVMKKNVYTRLRYLTWIGIPD